MNGTRKWWAWLAVAVLLVVGVAGYQIWQKKNAAPEYKLSRLERGSITASVSASGTLSPVVQVQVGSQVSGQLKEVLVDFNSEVRQGELIARIDPQTFETRVQQAQADVDAARAQIMTQHANIAAQRAALAKAEVDLAEAGRDLERKRQLVEKGFISGAERDKAQAVYNAAVEQVNTARAQVQVAAAGLRNAEAVVKQREAALAQARIDLGRTEIRAPVNGVVIKRSVERGQTVAASLQSPELFIIAENLTDMQVDASIDESEIGRIRIGQKASFTVDAFPGRSYEGTVKQIRKAALNVSNVVTYTVVISAANPARELLPGMTANVRVVTDSRSDVLKVANAALRFRPPGAASERPVSAMQGSQAAANGPGTPGGQMRALRERIDKDLQPDDSQKAKLDAIFAGQRDRFMALRDAPEGERQKMTERHRSEMQAEIAGMLTPEQKKKFEEILAETSGSRGGGGARGRLYVPDDKGAPKPVEVRVGLTDGTTTEVIGHDLKEGMQVITGTVQQQADSSRARPPAGPRLF